MPYADVAAVLVAYGRELEAQGAAQLGGSFSGTPAADELLERDPNAFLVGVLFTQGIPAERAWQAPYLLCLRLGTLEPAYLSKHADEVRAAVQSKPMLHRFKETLPRWIVSAADRLETHYDGDAAAIWQSGSSVLDVIERLSAFDGIGRKKAVMATEILARHFRVPFTDREAGQVAFDIHVRRVFLRSGLADEDSPAAIERAATRWSPDAPGLLDLPAWLIGRETCRPQLPHCDRCQLGGVCARRVWIRPAGVGQRPRATSR